MALSNKEIPTDLREYIEINILPQYATFDKAHMGHRTKRFFQWSGKMGERF